MKLNTRTLALVTALGIAGAASAQFRFFLAYGDTKLAYLNSHNYAGISNPAAALGSEIPAGALLKVPKATDNETFTLDLMVEKMGGGADDLYAGISTLVSFDRATAGNTGDIAQANMLDKKIQLGGTASASNGTLLNNSISNKASFGLFDNTGADLGESGTIGLPSRQLRGEYRAGAASLRGAGAGLQMTVADSNGTGSFFKLAVGSKTRILSLKFKSTLGAFEQYGTSTGGNGITFFTESSTAQQAGAMSYIHAQNAQNSGVHLNVQAVPEPGTMAAIFAGLTALGLRRRSK